MRAAGLCALALGWVAAGCGDDTTAATAGGGAGGSTTSATGATTASVGSGGSGTTDASSSSGAGAGGGGGADVRFVFDPIELSAELNLVTDMKFVPGAPDELLVLEKGGAVHHLRIDGDRAERLGGFVVDVHDDLDCGLISLAFSPEFAVDQAIYLGFCTAKTSSRVERFTFDAGDLASVPTTAETILVLEEPLAAYPWHNVGSIGFDPDGTMWVLSGDKTVNENARDLSRDLGKLLRIVPSPDGPGSTPAPDNPFVGLEGHSPNVWSFGLRSPWKGARDRFGRYWVGDVGLNSYEEVNVVLAAGADHGWPDHEGPCNDALDDGCIDPVAWYGRQADDPYLLDDPERLSAGTRAVWVGPYLDPVDDDPYQGALDDHLLFGDLHTGFVRILLVGDDGAILSDRPLGHLNHGHAWDRGPGGYLHVMTFGTLLAADTRTAELFRMRLE